MLGFEEALEIGLIQRLFDDADFSARVMSFAGEFVPPQRASKAVGLIKRAVQSGGEMSFHQALALERELQQRLFESHDAAEGLAAYVEKRQSRFEGR